MAFGTTSYHRILPTKGANGVSRALPGRANCRHDAPAGDTAHGSGPSTRFTRSGRMGRCYGHGIRQWQSGDCSAVHDRDLNAAINNCLPRM
jgi:hypothetical protein